MTRPGIQPLLYPHPRMQPSAGKRQEESRAAAASLPTPRTPVSVLVPTLNEAADLPGCLASLSFADQVCIVDSGSTDASGNRYAVAYIAATRSAIAGQV